jgi:hypothetical protein
MTRKRAFEKELRTRVTADAKLRSEYGGAWAAIEAAQRELKSISVQSRYYSLAGPNLLTFAGILNRLPQQTALADSLRLPAYRGNVVGNLRNQLLGPIPIDTTIERLTLTAWLQAAQQELDPKDPLLVALLGGRTPEQAAVALLRGTRLADPQVRRTLIEGGSQAVLASTDPLIAVARRVEPTSLELARRALRLNTTISANAEKVGRAQFAVYGKALPPDATFTLRISDGVVKGYPMNGTIAPYKTSFYGLYARSAEFDDRPPFQLPQRWHDRKNNIDMKTPLDFVSTNDIIGGNSGSPVINRNAEVVGLIFDGNIESLPNRFIFTDEVARSVSVHSRAITEALRNVYMAGWIADELEGRGM